MTREEFIKKFDEESKLQKIKKLETMSIEEYIAGPVWEGLSEDSSNCTINTYNEFVDLYEKYENNLIMNEEKKQLEFLYSLYEKGKNYTIEKLKREINDFKINLEYFCDTPNLTFEEWLNTYYVPNLYKIPSELMSDNYKSDRMLMVDVLNHKLTLEEYQKIIRNRDDLFYAKRYIDIDYNNYLKTQITKPTISLIFD